MQVKPAVFDLFLSAAIGCYLAVIYLLLNNSAMIVVFLTGMLARAEKDGEERNGHSKSNGLRNGHKNGHAF